MDLTIAGHQIAWSDLDGRQLVHLNQIYAAEVSTTAGNNVHGSHDLCVSAVELPHAVIVYMYGLCKPYACIDSS